MGFSEGCIPLLQSYLFGRILFTNIEKQLSDYVRIPCSVPQGFILGLLLFLMYNDDRPQAVSSDQFYMFLTHV